MLVYAIDIHYANVDPSDGPSLVNGSRPVNFYTDI